MIWFSTSYFLFILYLILLFYLKVTNIDRGVYFIKKFIVFNTTL